MVLLHLLLARRVWRMARGRNALFLALSGPLARLLGVVDEVCGRPILAIHEHCLDLIRFLVNLLASHIVIL